LAFLPAVSFAAAPTLSEVLDASGITLSGNVSGSYAYKKIDNTAGIGADGALNQFTLDQVHLTIAKQPSEGFGGLVDVFAGQDVSGNTYNYGLSFPAAGNVFYPTGAFQNFGGGSDYNLHQAYVSYATGGLTVIAGKFATLAGYEVASDAANSTATRSMIYAVQPFTLTGVRAGYKFNDMVTAYVGLSNSTGGATNEAAAGDPQKTTELGLALAPVKGLTVNLTGYIGTEAGNDTKTRLLDAVVAYSVGDLTVAANTDYFTYKQGGNKDTLAGTALYANYQLTKTFRAGVRGEMIRVTQNGAFLALAPVNKAKGSAVTLTGTYSAAKNFDLVTDLRYAVLKDDDGLSQKQKDSTAVVKAVYKF
ncbi:MAG: outer membrane beta-barrel protein, partial [Pseudomonadota bacterium]